MVQRFRPSLWINLYKSTRCERLNLYSYRLTVYTYLPATLIENVRILMKSLSQRSISQFLS